MPGLNCEKLSCVEQKYVEDQLCQSRNVKSRKVQVKICLTKVGEAHSWSRQDSGGISTMGFQPSKHIIMTPLVYMSFFIIQL